MAAAEYTYIVRNRRQQVGDEFRYPGDLIPEAASWTTLRIYLDNKYVERLAINDPEVVAAIKRGQKARIGDEPKAPAKPAEKPAPEEPAIVVPPAAKTGEDEEEIFTGLEGIGAIQQEREQLKTKIAAK